MYHQAARFPSRLLLAFGCWLFAPDWFTCSSRNTKVSPTAPANNSKTQSKQLLNVVNCSIDTARQLARSVQTVSLFLDPDGLDTPTLDRNAQQLAQSLGLKQAELTKRVSRSSG